ncbi:fatty acid desaturase 3 [Thecamonas trahens ATCC 50062]|uniref:Fatty acid desaturase 3 n=1 Tax=Thecamonas trahens ATCC 50062 TaxID=461836 RepID=A0A0L0D281_THETB|nr:fatty acid desaturase 3 [Thecamonas trahens ATCC 50062]KNC46235.1 fatty acid desaturase 3 [Thecamonas trahens ATCC 50062]|eukprot:XP_013760532.1 fatty acid desaturase 3 [Thecamonas trahens ATCC 50062]
MKDERVYSQDELRKGGKLLAISGRVYDVSEFIARHPGGKVLTYYLGQDATDAFDAFHPGRKATAMLPALEIGTMAPRRIESVEVEGDDDVTSSFRALRRELAAEGMFDAEPGFFLLQLAIIVAMEMGGVWLSTMAAMSGSWVLFWVAAAVLATAQIQSGWLQHDFGHLAVFKARWMNIAAHKVLMAGFKGASSPWWRSRHNRHHAKPNHLHADPDVHNEPLFLFDEVMSEEEMGWAGTFAQGWYWWLLGPPLVTTVVFLITNIVDCVKRGLWLDLVLGLSYLPRFWGVHMGWSGHTFWGAAGLYFAVRVLESMWFTWVTAMNHFPMGIVSMRSQASPKSWVAAQFDATQNLSPGAVADWFTGHLNYQIEHHLFPAMPRHNYPRIAPRITAFAARHGLAYNVASLPSAAAQVIATLHRVGRGKRQ